MLTPRMLADVMPRRPVLLSPRDGWGDLVLSRYRNMPNHIRVPELSENVIVAHCSGPVLIEGRGDATGAERQWVVQGQVGITPSGASITRSFKGKPDVILIHLVNEKLFETAEEVFDRDPAHLVLVPKIGETDELSYRLATLLLEEAERPSAGSCLMIETLARALMVHTLRTHSNLAPRAPEKPSTMARGRLHKVIDYMRAHVEEDVSLAELAEVGGLSPSRFSHAFRLALGQPPYRYFLGLRLAKARELLEHSDLSVLEVGLQCGFSQPSHFASVFRKAMGVAPREWRAERRR